MANDLTPAAFQKLLVKRLRKEGCAVEERGPLEIRIGSPESTFFLGNVYQQYCEGARIGHIVRKLLNVVQETNQVIASEDEPLDLTRLFPMLKSHEWLDGILPAFTDVPAWRPFVTPDVVVTLVEDMPTSLRYVRASEIKTLGRTVDDMLDIALDNLMERSEVGVHQLGNEEAGSIFVLDTKDGYDATRILLSPLMEHLAEKVKGNLILGIPNRDCLIAFGNANPITVEMTVQMNEDASTRPYALTSTLFTFQSGKLRVYKA
jgi:uncharacterized protein YtpQ (UPF0354 family)